MENIPTVPETGLGAVQPSTAIQPSAAVQPSAVVQPSAAVQPIPSVVDGMGAMSKPVSTMTPAAPVLPAPTMGSPIPAPHQDASVVRVGDAAVNTPVGADAGPPLPPDVGVAVPPRRSAGDKPNVVVVFTDDQGYSDVGVYGSGTAPAGAPWKAWDRIPIRTPNLDRMAAEGVRFTSFYSGAPTCTQSRAGLLTGSYPPRVGFSDGVLFPRDTTGLNPNEITLADLLRARGYKTAAFGKWHLGHAEKVLPTSNGFDEYFGIPFSNDMWHDPDIPIAGDARFLEGWTRQRVLALRNMSDGEIRASARDKVPLLRGTEVVEFPADQRSISRRYTDEAIRFMQQHHEEPFFVYVAHSMPHIPLFATDNFAGKSPRGAYGDVIEEIDFNVGRLLDAIREQGIEHNTVVVFTSDNGPWLRFNEEGGSAYPLRNGKSTNWEGGMRVPGIFWWPGTIPAGEVRDEPSIVMDLYPTFARLSGGGLPTGRITDGEDIWPIVLGQAGASHGPIYYDLNAIREGKWKLRSGALYDLDADIHEDNNVARQNPQVVSSMQAKLDAFNTDIERNSRPRGNNNTVVLPKGCTDAEAPNYDPAAEVDDGSCGIL